MVTKDRILAGVVALCGDCMDIPIASNKVGNKWVMTSKPVEGRALLS